MKPQPDPEEDDEEVEIVVSTDRDPIEVLWELNGWLPEEWGITVKKRPENDPYDGLIWS